MDIYNLITSRHSCRKFSNKIIPDKYLTQIIECGLSAPSAMNTQPWHFVIIKDKKIIKNLKDLTKTAFENSDVEWRKVWSKKENFDPFYNPQVLILVCNNNQIKNSQNDCCFAVMNMTLMAESLGLGSCIIQDICWAINEDNKQTYKIPNQFSIYLSIALGFPKLKNKNKKIFNNSKYDIIEN